ncbi:MAG: ATP synthase subunit I [Aquincola sp.]|nr:ATP synthase subunit I [Aquincola sp.]MDH5331461.1 ATP synthase subunit I [Aquincola sp.]
MLGKFVNPTTPDRELRSDPWADDTDEASDAAREPLTREQAQALLANSPHSVSPWRVIAVQAAVGGTAALLAGWAGARWDVFWSALYGAAVVVMPGALMARGMTRAPRNVSPGASAVSVMLWSMVKIGASIVMLLLASRLVQPLSWPALLATMVLCILVYWFALLKRGR